MLSPAVVHNRPSPSASSAVFPSRRVSWRTVPCCRPPAQRPAQCAAALHCNDIVRSQHNRIGLIRIPDQSGLSSTEEDCRSSAMAGEHSTSRSLPAPSPYSAPSRWRNFSIMECRGCGQHENLPAMAPKKMRWLERRFHADDRDIELCAQPGRCGYRRVARRTSA